MGECEWIAVLLGLGLAAPASAVEPGVLPEPLPPALLLTCTPAGERTVRLQLVALNAGPAVAANATVQVTFTAVPGAVALELAPSGPRSVLLPLATAGWAADQVELIDVGDVSLAPPCPEVLEVRAGLLGQAACPLGRLRRGLNGQAATFSRAYPETQATSQSAAAPTHERGAGLVFVAAYEPLQDRQFNLRLACFNCGGRRVADEDLFLHFECAPTGTDLQATTALGLPPAAQPTDSAGWHEGDLVVARFGPYSISRSLPESVYLRAGLYNRQGDGARANVAAPDDTRRALLGRLVTRAGLTWFERAPLPGSRVPLGWGAAPGRESR